MKLLTLQQFIAEAVFTNTSGEQFWGDLGAGVLPICTKTGRALLNHRSMHVNEPGTWGIWGGALDENERDPTNAALRELEEEAGYNGKIKLIPSYVYSSPNGGFKYYNFIGLVDSEFEPTFDWETHGYKWVELSELMKQPKLHFGLKALIDNDLKTIQKYMS